MTERSDKKLSVRRGMTERSVRKLSVRERNDSEIR
jgi:hypothetical protein